MVEHAGDILAQPLFSKPTSPSGRPQQHLACAHAGHTLGRLSPREPDLALSLTILLRFADASLSRSTKKRTQWLPHTSLALSTNLAGPVAPDQSLCICCPQPSSPRPQPGTGRAGSAMVGCASGGHSPSQGVLLADTPRATLHLRGWCAIQGQARRCAPSSRERAPSTPSLPVPHAC